MVSGKKDNDEVPQNNVITTMDNKPVLPGFRSRLT